MTTHKNILEASHLNRVLGRENFPAVRDVSLTIGEGEIHALLGPNGAGKTTTVRMCATLLTPSSGTIVINGIDAVSQPEEARARLGVVLGGDLGFYPRASARDNLLFFADLAGIPRRLRSGSVDNALNRVSLSGDAGTQVGAFSRGMKQRLHIARALLGNPRLLLLDEPTTGLDPDIALQVRDLIQELATDGVGVLLTSHSMSEIEELATTISVIGAGRIAVCGNLSDIALAAGISQTTTFTLSASSSDLRERIAHAVSDDGELDIRPRGSNWAVTVAWHTGTDVARKHREVRDLLRHATDQQNTGGTLVPDDRPLSSHRDLTGWHVRAADAAVPVDFMTRPATLEEAYLALADRLVR